MSEAIPRAGRLGLPEVANDTIEVRQLASSLCEKWNLAGRVRHTVDDLVKAVERRARKLKERQEQPA